MNHSNEDRSLLVAQAAEEFTTAIEAGEMPSVEAFVARYPDVADVLRGVLPALKSLGMEQDTDQTPGMEQTSGTCSDPIRAGSQETLGDFRLEEPIGRGGMGVVYRATQISIGRTVAVKVLPFAATLDANQLQRFRNEVRAAGTLNHPNIVPIYSVGEQRGVHYYAMQFIRGCSMAELIVAMREDQPVSTSLHDTVAVANALEITQPAEVDPTSKSQQVDNLAIQVATLGRQAAKGLAHAHACGVIHRDIKPANLMIDQSGKIWITDFGLAHVESGQSLTMPGDFIGTLRFMSPEQARGSAVDVSHRTDIYSLGISLYELLTGKQAIRGDSREQIISAVREREPIAPRKLNPAIPTELETILLKCYEKSPRDRYETAEDLARDFERFLERKPIAAKRPTHVERAKRWTYRHSLLVLSTAIVTSLLLVVTTGSIVWILHERDKAEQSRAAEMAERRRADRLSDSAKNLSASASSSSSQLGDVNRTLGRLQEAKDNYLSTLTILNELPSGQDDARYKLLRAETIIQLALIKSQFESNDGAPDELDEAIRILEGVKDQRIPDEPEWKVPLALASAKRLLAQRLLVLGQHELAIDTIAEAFQDSLPLLESQDPDVLHEVLKIRHQNAVISFHAFGVTTSRIDLEKEMNETYVLAKRMLKHSPQERVAAALLAKIAYDRSAVCDRLGKRSEALALIEESIELGNDLVDRFPERPTPLWELAIAYDRYATMLHDQAKFKEAIKQYRIAIELDKRLATFDEYAESLDFRETVIGRKQNFSNVLYRTKHAPFVKESARLRLETVQEWEELIKLFPGRFGLSANYAMAKYALAESQADPERSIELVADSIATMQQLAKQFPDTPLHRARLTTCHNGLAGHYSRAQEFEKAIVEVDRAIEIAEELATEFPTVADYHGKVARRYYHLGRLKLRTNAVPDAVVAFGKAVAVRKELRERFPEYSKPMHAVPNASAEAMLGVAFHRLALEDPDASHHEEATNHLNAAVKMAVASGSELALCQEIKHDTNDAEQKRVFAMILSANPMILENARKRAQK